VSYLTIRPTRNAAFDSKHEIDELDLNSPYQIGSDPHGVAYSLDLILYWVGRHRRASMTRGVPAHRCSARAHIVQRQ